MRLYISIIAYCCLPVLAQAQTPPEGSSLQATLGVGRIVRHSPKFKAEVRGITTTAELNWTQQTSGKAAWHTTHKLPTFGVSATYANFGDPEVFGEAFGLLPNIAFGNRSHCQKWHTYIRIGMGLAYVTKPFNPRTNATNTVIGQYLNNITDVRGGVGFWLSPKTELTVTAGISHFSDAASQLPNLGINVPALNIGLRYTPRLIAQYAKTAYEQRGKRWHGLAQLDYGSNEQTVEGGAKYFIGSLSAGALYDFSALHHFFGGINYEFSETAYRWMQYQRPDAGDAAHLDQASRLSLFVGDEFYFGQFAFGITVGGYLKQSAFTNFPIYEKLALRYYFLPDKTVHPYLSTQLKAHLSIAEYYSIGVGILF